MTIATVRISARPADRSVIRIVYRAHTHILPFLPYIVSILYMPITSINGVRQPRTHPTQDSLELAKHKNNKLSS